METMPEWFRRRLEIGTGIAGGISRDAGGNYYVWFDDVHHLMLDVDGAELFRRAQLDIRDGVRR